ncbi:MAG: esterase [Burkholderiales bacterium]|nr:esterase [Burkholderiales bacterium]
MSGGSGDAADAPTHLLYLHGFRSSPRSFKALRLQDWLRRNRPELVWQCPQLPPSPRAAIEAARAILDAWPAGRFAVAGSSLGGFYATVLAEATGCRAVLLNPAVDPARDLAPHVGEQTLFHDPSQRFEFRPEYVDELRVLAPTAITRPERYLAIIAKGDEVLDWREMSARYAGCPMRLIEGSDHGLSDFDDHLPFLLDFLRLKP